MDIRVMHRPNATISMGNKVFIVWISNKDTVLCNECRKKEDSKKACHCERPNSMPHSMDVFVNEMDMKDVDGTEIEGPHIGRRSTWQFIESLKIRNLTQYPRFGYVAKDFRLSKCNQTINIAWDEYNFHTTKISRKEIKME